MDPDFPKERDLLMLRKLNVNHVFLLWMSAIFVVIALSGEVRAEDDQPTVFDVRRSLPMEASEAMTHDFLISAGIDRGIKKDIYLPVVRMVPIHDPIQNKQHAVITVPVGYLQVIHVERNMAIARLVSELNDSERPTLEFETIMIGDKIDLRGMSTEAPKIKGRKSNKSKNENASEQTPERARSPSGALAKAY